MRGPSGPGENDARVQPPTHKKNARRIERHPARCTRHQGRGRCPSEFLSNTSSRRAIVCFYPVRMGLESCRSVAKKVAFQDFQARENFVDRARRAPWSGCILHHLGLEPCRSGSKITALQIFQAREFLERVRRAPWSACILLHMGSEPCR